MRPVGTSFTVCIQDQQNLFSFTVAIDLLLFCAVANLFVRSNFKK